MEIAIDIIGWIGSILLLAAYYLISQKKWTAETLYYQLFNLIGGFFLLVNTAYYGSYPSSMLNLVWGIVGIFAIRNILKKPQQHEQTS